MVYMVHGESLGGHRQPWSSNNSRFLSLALECIILYDTSSFRAPGTRTLQAAGTLQDQDLNQDPAHDAGS